MSCRKKTKCHFSEHHMSVAQQDQIHKSFRISKARTMRWEMNSVLCGIMYVPTYYIKCRHLNSEVAILGSTKVHHLNLLLFTTVIQDMKWRHKRTFIRSLSNKKDAGGTGVAYLAFGSKLLLVAIRRVSWDFTGPEGQSHH